MNPESTHQPVGGPFQAFTQTKGLDPIYSAPTVDAAGDVYFGSDSTKVHAVHSDGTVKWTKQISALVRSKPALDKNGVLYVGAHNAFVYALDTATGAEIWKFKTGGAVQSSPAVGLDGRVHVGSDDTFLYTFQDDTSLSAHCYNGIQDAADGETDVDCGGPCALCACAVVPTAPGGACPPECTYCITNTCVMGFPYSNQMLGQTINCPAGFKCEVTCSGPSSCKQATINCPADYDCKQTCSGPYSCEDMTLNCDNGPCRYLCTGPFGCEGMDVMCGAGLCKNDTTCASLPTVTCGQSCDCQTCGGIGYVGGVREELASTAAKPSEGAAGASAEFGIDTSQASARRSSSSSGCACNAAPGSGSSHSWVVALVAVCFMWALRRRRRFRENAGDAYLS